MKLEPLQWKYITLIELHDVLDVSEIPDTLYSIIEHGCWPDCSFVNENEATTVGFPTFIFLEKTNKEITLDDDIPLKEKHSQQDYTNLPSYFNKTTVWLIHDKSAIPTISTEESAAYDLHSVEMVSIKPSDREKINTGVNVHLPQGSVGSVTSRSSMATNHGTMVPTGTIDCDYTGKSPSSCTTRSI